MIRSEFDIRRMPPAVPIGQGAARLARAIEDRSVTSDTTALGPSRIHLADVRAHGPRNLDADQRSTGNFEAIQPSAVVAARTSRLPQPGGRITRRWAIETENAAPPGPNKL
ncbi:hypothetical protein TUM20983_36630 [Mycobacterium antarcticum]|nr:hypothetical protein TUM20983_36630 [Mycolicibacterium sp. TUM20983]